MRGLERAGSGKTATVTKAAGHAVSPQPFGVPLPPGWSAELSYTGPRCLFLGWTAELSYIRTYLMMGEELGN